MAPVYADHPFQLIPTPKARLKEGEPDDQFVACATDMALGHNILVRGLNSIYLQAPHIVAKDEQAFLQFIKAWYSLLHAHHTGEEESFFPDIEAMAGEQGIMAANIAQHRAFHAGLETFIAYVNACVAGTEKYDGARIVTLVDAFGEILTQHLGDEIPTLMALRQYGDKMKGYRARFNEEGERNMRAIGLFVGVPWVFANHDVDYEGGIHDFPPAPAFLGWFMRNIAYHVHADWWKFAPCDRQGHMQPLSFISTS